MTDLPDTDTLKGLHDKLGGVTVPDLMHGDNLAITLCTAYDNPDQDTDDETGWTPDAIAGQEAVLAAIRAHYDPAIARVIEQDAEIERLTEALHKASDPDMIRAALDSVHDMDVTLADYAKSVSDAIRAALAKQGGAE